MAGGEAVGVAAEELPYIARALLTGPALSSHMLQLYDDPAFLSGVVSEYVAGGLRRGEPVLLVMRAALGVDVLERLRARGHDVDARVRGGAIVVLDARDLLDSVLVGGVPDRARFRCAVGDALERIAGTSCRGHVRAYGEAVDLLAADGRCDAAVALERLWNELAGERPLSLLCAYDMARFAGEADADVLAEVCDAHTHVIPTERYAQLPDADARLREVAQLQQRARALESEIAERKQIEEALRESLRLRDDFLAVVGHELRTPLTAAQLLLESLLRARRIEVPPPVHERLGKVARSLGRLGKLIDGLVDGARFSSGAAQLVVADVDLAALVRSVVEEQAPTLQAACCNVELVADEPVVGRWDRDRLEQVVTNLVSNAGKYSSGRPVTVRVERGARRARLVVQDRGIGIAPADQRRIFERFERVAVRPEVWGLGLGLWIAREAVEAHGGTIAVTSALGEGATFTVELPYAR